MALSDFRGTDDDDERYDHAAAYEAAKLADLRHRWAAALANADGAWREYAMWSDQARLIQAMIERLGQRAKLQ
jgi:hypothetical protein